MLDRRDPPLADGLEEILPLHALAFYWEGFDPKLDCYDSFNREVVQVGFDPADFVVGGKKVCIGRFEGDRYLECPGKTPVTKFSQCDECAGEAFIEDLECIFEPKCDGSRCDNEFCKRQHVLYLAFYDTMAKIGMSSTRRVERRLVEQGADAFAIIGTFPNRLAAREGEKEISSELDIPQWVKQQTILSRFSRPLDHEGLRARYDELRTRLGETRGLSVEPLRRLEGYPLRLPLPAAPVLQDTPGVHIGRLVGVKGKWLVYESGGLKALNLSDLPGRFLADKYLVQSLKINK